jgi:hypothetical protein
MKKIILLTLIAIGTLTNYAQSTIENFSYGSSMDTLTNPANGGVNWKRHSGTSGSFTSSLIYNTTSLTYAGYSSSGVGGAVEVWGVARSEDANRMVSAYTSGSVYASFLLRIDSVNSLSTVGDYFVHFGDTFGAVTLTNFKSRMFTKIGSVANTYKIGLTKSGAGSVAVFSPDYAFGTTVLVVLKYKFDLSATANDSVSAYIFTSGVPTTEPTTPTIVASDITATDYTILRSFCLRQGSLANSQFKALVDGIRVSNSWSTSVLPVKFASFNAIINNKQTNLTWTTASEINNKGFEIERSLDGVNFEIIGFVKGNANANRINKYSFIDDNHASAFYRLKQIDFDGKFDYSNIISVQGNDLLIDITPNPFNNVIEINSNGHLLNVEVLDITGKIVISEAINGSKTTLNTAGLNNGVYFVRINNGESVITKRLIKN